MMEVKNFAPPFYSVPRLVICRIGSSPRHTAAALQWSRWAGGGYLPIERLEIGPPRPTGQVPFCHCSPLADRWLTIFVQYLSGDGAAETSLSASRTSVQPRSLHVCLERAAADRTRPDEQFRIRLHCLTELPRAHFSRQRTRMSRVRNQGTHAQPQP